jgi:hypothetical protein
MIARALVRAIPPGLAGTVTVPTRVRMPLLLQAPGTCLRRTPSVQSTRLHKNRLEAFSDGVVAIIITIMVLELKVPHETTWDSLVPVLPVFFSLGG